MIFRKESRANDFIPTYPNPIKAENQESLRLEKAFKIQVLLSPQLHYKDWFAHHVLG